MRRRSIIIHHKGSNIVTVQSNLEHHAQSRRFRISFLRRRLHNLLDASLLMERGLFPLLDLIIRLWLGQTFFVSGLIKATDMKNAVFLATEEYPVPWMDPEMAAWLGMGIELFGGAMLILGVGTRFAALPILILSLVIQFNYIAIDLHLYWALFAGWFLVAGAGPISLDFLFGQGLKRAPIPLARPLGKVFDSLTFYGTTIYLFLLRVWIAIIFFKSGLTKYGDFENTVFLFTYEYQTPFLPPLWSAILATLFELACPIFLIAGLFTRLATLPLLAMTAVIQFTYLSHIDHLFWAFTFGIILLKGPGVLSADHLLRKFLNKKYPELTGGPAFPLDQVPHVVVVGAGFGGLACVRALRYAPCRITLIDRHNYHLFQPLLYQVATGGLAPSDIAEPIRSLVREQANATVLLGRVMDVDKSSQEVVLEEGNRVPYDYLVLATGARHGYFGRDNEWAPIAPGLKKIEDGTDIRRRLLTAFEKAELLNDTHARKAYMTFVIVGGGPTGVELAGAVAELAKYGLKDEFRHIDPRQAHVILVQSGPRLLPAFPERLSQNARDSLERLGVDVRTHSRVQEIDTEGVIVSGERIAAKTVIWAAGVLASPAAKWLQSRSDRVGRVVVQEDLSVEGYPGIFAIGDTATSSAWNGHTVPGLAPAAKQGGEYVAETIRRRIEARSTPKPFRYKHAGNLATIGRKAAVADLKGLRFTGALAWWFWGAIHVMFLAGTRNRIAVIVQWIWAYVTYRGGIRLITGGNERSAKGGI